MTVDTTELDSVIAKINRKYEDALILGSEQLDVKRISTGSPELDGAMGGGIPLSRFTRFYGGEGSTKTMTALCCIAEAQRQGLSCVLFNAEKRFDREFAERLGVNVDKLYLVNQTSIEAIGEIWESLLDVAHFFVVDSCSIAVSEYELNADIRDWRPGITARAWGKVFRRINERWNIENTAILIDQVRVDFRTGSHNPSGGKIFDHQSSLSVLFKSGKWLFRGDDGVLSETAKQNRGQDGSTVPAGKEIKIRIEKSSVSRPYRTATLHFDLDTLVYDRVYEYMKAARHYKVITGERGHYKYIDELGDVTRIHGEPKLREFIAGSTELQKFIYDVILESAEESRTYDEEAIR